MLSDTIISMIELGFYFKIDTEVSQKKIINIW